MRTFWKRLRATLSTPRQEDGLDDELRFHLELQIAENLRLGMPPEQAHREALLAFGGIEQVKEKYRDRLRFAALESLLQDLAFGWRLLARSPGFAIAAVLTLALGIGANTAVFSLVDAVILRPLPLPQPDRLMAILGATKDGTRQFSSAEGVYLDWRERAKSFESIAGADSRQGLYIGSQGPLQIRLGRASFDFFTVLGVRPLLGRVFTTQEAKSESIPAALLGEDFWRTEFGGDRAVLGRTLRLGSGEFRIAGILPSSFRFANFGVVDVWAPLHPEREWRTGGPVIPVGRLRKGVSRAAAQRELESIMQQIRRERPEDSRLYVAVRPLGEWLVARVRQPFLMLWGAVTFVLLICCANIANLLLARASTRRREMATRAALGAGQWRLMRQTLVEGGLLAILGGVLGLLGAIAALHAIPHMHTMSIPRAEEIAVNGRVLTAGLLLSMASAMLFSLPPALQFLRGGLHPGLYSGDGLGRIGGNRLRSLLVAAQLALALVLLTGAGLMTNGLVRLLTIDLGFDSCRLFTVNAELPFGSDDRKRSYQLELRLAQEVSRIRGVDKVTVVENPPLANVHFQYYLETHLEDIVRQCQPEARHVGAGYLAVTGIPLLSGRDFEPGDESRSPVPILINGATAMALFGAADPMGKTIASRFYKGREVLKVVGVVGDARQLTLTGAPGPQIYVPAIYGYGRQLLVRVHTYAPDLGPPIRAAVHRLFGAVPTPVIKSLDDRLSDEVAQPRFYMMLLGGFALAGLLMASIGVYGAMAYSIVRRTREIGVRMALGAEPRAIRRMLLGSGLRMTLVGVAMGLAGAFAVTPVLTSLLYEVKPNDPFTFACVVTLLAAIAMLACYLAARKATRIQPTEALRCE